MCPLTVDYSWGYTMPCKEHYSYTWTKGYGSDRLNAAGGYADGRQEFPIVKDTTPNITNSRLNNIP